MRVKNLILYQISTDRNYKVGDKLTFGEAYNGLADRIFNTKFGDGKNAFYKLGFEYADSKNIFKKKDLVIDLCKTMQESDFVLRELAVEEVRKTKYPNLPSRLRCMFLSDTKQVVLDNLKTFHLKGVGKHFQAVAVKLTGELFYAKSIALPRNGLSYGEYIEIADKYWSQDQNSTESIKEILFEGKAEIIDILDEYILNDQS